MRESLAFAGIIEMRSKRTYATQYLHLLFWLSATSLVYANVMMALYVIHCDVEASH